MKLLIEFPYIFTLMLLGWSGGAIYLVREYGDRFPAIESKRLVILYLGSVVLSYVFLSGILSMFKG